MAVCNLFKTLDNNSGNFLMFSQYVEDITCNYTNGDNYKVVPTQFIALNIDYANINKDIISPDRNGLNIDIPKFFQNYFENACAYARSNHENWTPEISKNLFWNFMFDGEIINIKNYDDSNNENKYVPEIVYYNDINMHSYNNHQGMGYGEIYCYIPTDAKRVNCKVIKNNKRTYDTSNTSLYLEGFNSDPTKLIGNYNKLLYSYNKDYILSTDDEIEGFMPSKSETKYNINTIIVNYSIFNKLNDKWEVLYENIPMGIYFSGIFDNDNKLTNEVTKYVTTSYGTGTSYGLRICTRFSSISNGNIINNEIITDDSGYTNMCQLMTAMNENLSKMLEISKSAIDTTQQYKELLSIFKNNRTNVPYVKDVNGSDYWFVNGKFVSAVNKGVNLSCSELSPETVQQRLNNLMDDDPTNDFTYIEDPNGCNCTVIDNKELADYLGIEFKENENDTPIQSTCCNYDIANNDDIIDILK